MRLGAPTVGGLGFPTVGGVLREAHEGVGGAGGAVGQLGGGQGANDLKLVCGLHLDGDVLQQLVVERVGAVKLNSGANR